MEPTEDTLFETTPVEPTEDTLFETTPVAPPNNGHEPEGLQMTKTIAGRHEVWNFVAANMDPTQITAADARRLFPEAKALFPGTSLESIANTLYRVKKAHGLPTNPGKHAYSNQYLKRQAGTAAAKKTRRKKPRPRLSNAQAAALKRFLLAQHDPAQSDRGNALRLRPVLAQQFPGAHLTEKSLTSHMRRLRQAGHRMKKKPLKKPFFKKPHWTTTPNGKARLDAIKAERENGDRVLGGRVAKEEVITLAREGAQTRLAFHLREVEKLRIFLGGDA